MIDVYLLRNQHHEYLDRSGEWVNGSESKSLYRTEFKDEAINQKVKFSVKNAELRIEIATGTVEGKGKVILSDPPPPAPINEETETETTLEAATEETSPLSEMGAEDEPQLALQSDQESLFDAPEAAPAQSDRLQSDTSQNPAILNTTPQNKGSEEQTEEPDLQSEIESQPGAI